MKLGKEALLAIVESALFVIGAFFFMLVLIIPSNPVWALIMGILFGLAGAIVWLYPYLVRLIIRLKPNTDVASISQKIQGADNPENNSYELHRSDSYANYDEMTAPVAEPKAKSKSKSAPKPKPEPEPIPEPEPEPEVAKPEPEAESAPEETKPEPETKPETEPEEAN